MAQRLNRRRLRDSVAGVAATGLVGLALTGCGTSDALALARQACAHVERSLALAGRAARSTDPAVQRADAAAAQDELRKALPLASTAAGEAPQWQALMTTLSESPRVPVTVLASALTQQCADARSGGQPAPPPTTSTAPAPIVTRPDVGR